MIRHFPLLCFNWYHSKVILWLTQYSWKWIPKLQCMWLFFIEMFILTHRHNGISICSPMFYSCPMYLYSTLWPMHIFAKLSGIKTCHSCKTESWWHSPTMRCYSFEKKWRERKGKLTSSESHWTSYILKIIQAAQTF